MNPFIIFIVRNILRDNLIPISVRLSLLMKYQLLKYYFLFSFQWLVTNHDARLLNTISASPFTDKLLLKTTSGDVLCNASFVNIHSVFRCINHIHLLSAQNKNWPRQIKHKVRVLFDKWHYLYVRELSLGSNRPFLLVWRYIFVYLSR